MTNELADLLPWLDGYVVGQVRSYGDDFEGADRDDIIKKLQSFEPENETVLALVRRCPDFAVVPVKNRVMLIVDTDVVHVWQYIGIEDE